MAASNERTIIADTSGLVSLFHPKDSNHEVAVAAAQRLREHGVTLLVPVAVYLELLNILGRIMAGSSAAGSTTTVGATANQTSPAGSSAYQILVDVMTMF